MKRLRNLYKTSPFAQSLRQTQILVLKILKVFLRLKSSPSSTLDKIERFVKVSPGHALVGLVLIGAVLGAFPLATQAAKGEVYVVCD
jgi:hypothetical protein